MNSEAWKAATCRAAVWLVLSSLLAAVAAAAEQSPEDEESRALEAIEELGGFVWNHNAVYFRLAVSDAELKEAVPHLRKLPNLRMMSLNFSRVSDEGLASLRELAQLEVLTVKVTHVTDNGLAHLEKMSRLKEVDLRLTDVTDTGVAALRKALPDAKVTYSGRGEPAREAEALRGTWRGKIASPEGEEQPGGERTMIVAGNDLALGPEIGHFALKPDSEPQSIDVEVTDCLPGLNTPWSRYLGIYRLEGDTLVFCLSPVYGGRNQRPTKFSPEGLRGWMYVFERVRD